VGSLYAPGGGWLGGRAKRPERQILLDISAIPWIGPVAMMYYVGASGCANMQWCVGGGVVGVVV
jgi:hypothetical protein